MACRPVGSARGASSGRWRTASSQRRRGLTSAGTRAGEVPPCPTGRVPGPGRGDAAGPDRGDGLTLTAPVGSGSLPGGSGAAPSTRRYPTALGLLTDGPASGRSARGAVPVAIPCFALRAIVERTVWPIAGAALPVAVVAPGPATVGVPGPLVVPALPVVPALLVVPA